MSMTFTLQGTHGRCNQSTDVPYTIHIPPGKPSINGPFSIAMLVHQRVYPSINMGLSENVGLIFPMKQPFFIGIMISKTIGPNGVHYFQTHPDVYYPLVNIQKTMGKSPCFMGSYQVFRLGYFLCRKLEQITRG